MESQDVEKDVTLPDKDEDPFSETAGLAIVLERLRAYLGVRAEAKDIEILSFSLHHLFYSFNILFQRTLSQLTVSSSQVAESELPRQELGTRYRSWTSLQEIMRLLERIEALCQLLNGAATSMLTFLNTISSIEAIADVETVELGHSDDQNWDSAAASEQREQISALLRQCLNNWLACHNSRLSFASRFANLLTIIPTLTDIDTACDLLLENACAIFGDSLQDFQAIAVGDDEAVATLLLDLMQKADQLLFQINIMLGPLHELIRLHGMNVEML